jgi:hypothetical protein
MTKSCINQVYVIDFINNIMLNLEVKYSKDGVRDDG